MKTLNVQQRERKLEPVSMDLRQQQAGRCSESAKLEKRAENTLGRFEPFVNIILGGIY